MRRRIIPCVDGDVLEIGVGAGANFKHYDPANVRKLYALEPNRSMLRIPRRQRLPDRADEHGVPCSIPEGVDILLLGHRDTACIQAIIQRASCTRAHLPTGNRKAPDEIHPCVDVSFIACLLIELEYVNLVERMSRLWPGKRHVA